MHNFDIKTLTRTINGRELTVETGRMAKQAGGAVFMTYGGTSILVTATVSKNVSEGQDFFPLTVDFIEKYYASGKIPGGFFKREARPSTAATLSARLIDRAIRPLFPDGFRNSVHVVITVLSYDQVNDPAVIGILGASMALSISEIPFNGPIAGVKMGMIDGKFIINPTAEELETSRLNLDVAGTETSIVMIEAGALELSEEDMTNAIYTGHETIKELIVMQKELTALAGKEKIEVVLDIIPEPIISKVEADFGEKISAASNIKGKLERQETFEAIKEEMLKKYEEDDDVETYITNERYYQNAYEALIKKFVRYTILHNHHRVDGRGLDDIRPITCEIDILKQTHGSALFTRGETQSLGILTLGTERDMQIIDSMDEEYKKHYFLHYNFPPFSVGEAGFMRGPGRRELGHGALAERALEAMIPSKEEFPYTIRMVSEILESNGSSSMASVCSGTLALMAGGVPIKKPVAGIANGLIMEGEDFVVLTDIMGLEDHLGDMDFKVTGTYEGITAIQMDIKIEGITKEIMGIALQKAKVARAYILDQIVALIPEPRAELSTFAPRIETMKINPDKIGAVIGSGGKTIKMITELTGVDINIDDDGQINIASPDVNSINKAREMILSIVEEPRMGVIYDAKVFRTESFGALVKFMNGMKEGLVHISKLHTARINQTEDVVKVGDEVKVKLLDIDNGKYRLSMVGIPGNPQPDPSKIQAAPRPSDRGSYDRGSSDRNSAPRSNYRDRDSRGGGSRDRDRNRSTDNRHDDNRNRDK
ncbi:MAG: polyribonucleotide nucleotidyltransferase [Candidatus Cloacimonetes bacterium]|nr:polyribonucleotide nucleotidyltransferase [Candidatus Cloacimonadota bacterium]